MILENYNSMNNQNKEYAKLAHQIFVIWLEKKHPRFLLVIGIVKILITIAFIVSLISVLWTSNFWKYLIVVVACYLVFQVYIKIMMSIYVDEYKEKK